MTCDTKALSAALSAMLPVCAKRTTPPILNCVRLEAAQGVLSVVASDLDCEVHRSIPCDGDLAACCVNGRQFSDVITYAGKSVDLSVKGKRLLIAGSGNASLSLNQDDFPPFMAVGKAQGVPVDDLAEGIRFAEGFASKDSSRYVLNSVHLKCTAKMMMVESAAGIVFGRMERPLLCAEFEALFPDRHAKAVADELEREAAVLSVDEKTVSVASKDGRLTVRQMEERWPNSQEIYDLQRDAVGSIDRDALIEALKACNAITTAINDNIRLGFGADFLTVEHKSSDNDCLRMVSGSFTERDCMVAAHNILPALEAMPKGAISLSVVVKSGYASALVLASGDFTALVCLLR